MWYVRQRCASKTTVFVCFCVLLSVLCKVILVTTQLIECTVQVASHCLHRYASLCTLEGWMTVLLKRIFETLEKILKFMGKNNIFLVYEYKCIKFVFSTICGFSFSVHFKPTFGYSWMPDVVEKNVFNNQADFLD